jgi:hypothetical protein
MQTKLKKWKSAEMESQKNEMLTKQKVDEMKN